MSNQSKEYPIIFRAESIRAILEGRKTQTRRIMKPQPEIGPPLVECAVCGQQKHVQGRSMGVLAQSKCHHECPGYWKEPFPSELHPGESRGDFGYPVGWEGPCPYGEPGDLLWVRETWRQAGFDRTAGLVQIRYRADGEYTNEANGNHWRRSGRTALDTNWRSPIYMFKWATRIWLRRTIKRTPEQLQEISEADAIAEGFAGTAPEDTYDCAVDEYEAAWGSIHAKPGKRWADNPFVWPVEFERTEPPR